MSITKVQINRATVGNLSGSRSFTSSSLASRVTTEATNVDNLQTDSGSFSTRVTDLVTASSSFSGSIATLRGAGSLQGVGTSDSPTFAGATITGTLTAQEVHTEFESASILFSSGSTQFGNSSDDIHDFKGNTISGSATSTGSFGSIVAGGTGVSSFTGNVGIGGSPSQRLDVQDTADPAQIRLKQSGNSNGLLIKNFNGNESQIVNVDNGPLVFKTNDNEVVRFTATGTIGIGTNTPRDGKLHIHNGSSGAVSYVQLTQDGTGAASGDGLLVGVNAAEASIIYNAEDTPLIFYTDKNERVRIDNNGNVGIGTNSPDATLDLRGTQKIQTNTVPASLIVGTNDTTDHTGQDSALAIDFRNLSTTNGVAGGLVGLDKDGLELSKILLVTDNHDANTSSIKMFTSTNAAQRTQMVNINNDGVTVGGSASAQRALHVQGTTGLCLSDGDRDRAALLPVSPDADTGHMQFNTRSGGTSRERMRLTSTGNLCVGPSGSSAGFTPALTVTGANPSLGLRLQDGNSGTFFNTILAGDGNSIRAFYSQEYRLATAANDGGTSENTRFALDTSGNISIDGNLTEGSDIRLKTNIEKIPDVLDVLDEIKPVKFEWKEDVEEGIEKKHIGLIAQEVEPHFPELIYEGTTRDTDDETYKGLNYAGLTPILLKSVQELSSKVNELQQKIEELEK